jgi:predicted P-loop ATPase
LSEIPQQIRVNVFNGATDNVGTPYNVTWAQLTEALSVHDVRPGKEGSLFNCVELSGLRRKENVTAVNALVLDLEHMAAGRADAILDSLAPFAYVLYTSHRSRHREPYAGERFGKEPVAGEVRCRVVIPYSRPVTPELHDRIWGLFAQWIPEMDPKCREPAHFYYLPSCPVDGSGLALIGHGSALDVDASYVRDFVASPSAATVADQSQARPVHEVSEGRFQRVVKALAKSSKPTAAAFERLLKGVPYAVPGERDNTLFQMVAELAAAMPNADPQSVASHFASSLSFMALEAGGAPTEADVAYKFARAVVALGGATDEVELIRNTSGTPVATDENIRRVLSGDVEIKEAFAYNEFASKIMVMGKVPWGAADTARELHDHDLTSFSAWVFAKYWLNVKPGQILAGIAVEAKNHAFHPVREYLAGIAWDGTPRLDTWLQTHMGVADSPYARKVSAWFLMQAVKRVLEPGCKADYALLQVGAQGAGKSTLAEVLASEAWFTDDVGQIGSKDSNMNIAGRWIVELAELSSVRKADSDTVKRFITCKVDKFRVPYGKLVDAFPRQCVFIGTTNDHMPLVDRTGNRRYWPVQVQDTPLDVEAFSEIRDQLWAEAAHRVALGERYWPEGADLAEFAAEASKFETEDSLSDCIDEWLANPAGYDGSTRLTTRYAMVRILGLDHATRQDELRATACLIRAGFKRIGKEWTTPAGWQVPKKATHLALIRNT